MKPPSSAPENKLTLRLSTGYEVGIDLLDARKGLEHLARALMGEIMFPNLKRSTRAAKKSKPKSGWITGLEAAAAEIRKIIHKCDTPDLRTLLIAVIWAYLAREFDRIEERENAAN